ncbi:polysaccharide deacetylase family protein (plasmid) [Sphingobium sp. V4]|uniref:polysaccharide deacetylase family protein n=1 Tax=Sphingobium sp. V4 TaxID=3038927 RepID=UPI002558202F|nr:polysaccharide deacetylase family protein [Sphingobium sp. V4]WIW90412.1 polysaccharide deacetylase family protein [Sphingobium sp. V4]
MSLDPTYLTYPRRAEGMDHDLYRWSNLFDRAPITWPGAAKLAVSVVISLEWFPITPSDTPFRAPGHMQTAYPDYRHYTSREYGTRIGFYRMLDALAAVGAKASVAVNSVVADRYPALIRDIVAAGHEIVAHATDMNATIATGLAEEEERAIIRTSLDMLEKATGQRPAGWLSIARSQSWNTPRLLAEEGVGYVLDWVNDELPYAMNTASGGIVNVPLNHELSDRQIITTQQHSADSYRVQIEDAADWLMAEAQSHGGRMLPLHVTPYIMGLPYRIGAFEALLRGLAGREGLAFLSTGDIAASL